MAVFEVEQATVYRANGRRFFSRTAAIRAYAKGRIREKHPCDCEGADYENGYPGYDCGCHARLDRVLPRFVRLIRKALRKQPAAVRGETTSAKPTPEAVWSTKWNA
jgi:hypothetical protein